jgi:hypothetical protein
MERLNTHPGRSVRHRDVSRFPRVFGFLFGGRIKHNLSIYSGLGAFFSGSGLPLGHISDIES